MILESIPVQKQQSLRDTECTQNLDICGLPCDEHQGTRIALEGFNRILKDSKILALLSESTVDGWVTIINRSS
jgi:hypothetical protein